MTEAGSCSGYTFEDMTEATPDRINVEFSTTEAKLIVAALRQFEPFWPADMDDMSPAQNCLPGSTRGSSTSSVR